MCYPIPHFQLIKQLHTSVCNYMVLEEPNVGHFLHKQQTNTVPSEATKTAAKNIAALNSSHENEKFILAYSLKPCHCTFLKTRFARSGVISGTHSCAHLDARFFFFVLLTSSVIVYCPTRALNSTCNNQQIWLQCCSHTFQENIYK